MKKNESKSKTTEPVETPEAPDTQSETRTDVERPADTPTDGEGCEGVTVIIVAGNKAHGALMAHSVQKYLTGVDADIHLVTEENLRDTLAETLAEHLPYVKTERIILMTDGMVILNPVTLGDIACVKAKKVGEVFDFSTNIPVLMHKSALNTLLSEAAESGLDHIDVIDSYFKGTLPEGFSPVILGEWKSDPWLLPAVTRNPSIEAVGKYAKWKKFMHISPDSWSDDLVKYLEDRFSI